MKTTLPQQTIFAEKKHFDALDGLRGIAAIAVVLFHFMEIAAPDYKDSFIPHSYLAVDFFFCLSGFVIAYAYDQRLGKIGKWEFFKRRLIRLHPLVVLGTGIGLLAFIFDPFSNLSNSFSTIQILLLFLSGCFLIPYPIVPQRYNNLFHLNPPTWSLFWEYLANIIYAFFLVKASRRMLSIILVLSAILLCWESYQSGYLAVGFGGDNFWAGAIRVSFSFTAGLFLYRNNWIVPNNKSFWFFAVALSAVFFIPFHEQWSALVDPLIVVFYFPFLIAFAAGKEVRSKTEKTTLKFFGNLSYPLYMLHYPLIWIFMSYVEKHQPDQITMTLWIILGMIGSILFAQLVLKFVDEPIRKVLAKKAVR